MSLLEDDDEGGFILAVEAAEAAAFASSKRPRLSTSPVADPRRLRRVLPVRAQGQPQLRLEAAAGSPKPRAQAARRLQGPRYHKRPDRDCFKCGDTSHWARDCPQSQPASGGGGGGGGGTGGGGCFVDTEVKVEEKECPCGSGICLVLTSSTPKNPGRRIYRCPMWEQDRQPCESRSPCCPICRRLPGFFYIDRRILSSSCTCTCSAGPPPV